MVRKAILWVIWIGFVTYTIWLAPLDHAETWAIAKRLLTLQWNQLNAIIPVIFSLMGVWPMIYAGLMFADGRMQSFRAWPYFIGSNFTGVICLLPYLIFRKSNQQFYGMKDQWLRLVDRRSTGITLLGTTIALFVYAFVAGDWSDYVRQFQTVPFVHLISLDFCLMCLTFPITSLFDDDMTRRGLHDDRWFWAVALIPLFGPLVYLCLRPPLAEQATKSSKSEMTTTPLEIEALRSH
ncbi:MAG TPA: DUF2834 domain-containing protein [Crinalium sp.]|jgi:hypothetical protein